jgi:hypothetical protein
LIVGKVASVTGFPLASSNFRVQVLEFTPGGTGSALTSTNVKAFASPALSMLGVYASAWSVCPPEQLVAVVEGAAGGVVEGADEHPASPKTSKLRIRLARLAWTKDCILALRRDLRGDESTD